MTVSSTQGHETQRPFLPSYHHTFTGLGIWGYHPLLISLAETREPLRIVNRSGNQTSEDGAARECDGVADYLKRCGFRKIVFRGDTSFSQTQHLDRWNERRVTFYFGYKAMENLEESAEHLAKSKWKKLKRPARYTVTTKPRAKGHPVKENIVIDREYNNLVLQREDVAEFDYRPTACSRSYRMIVVRKQIDEMKGQKLLLNKERYLFYITNDRTSTPAEIVFTCNDRCEQENLIEQLKNGPRALKAPVDPPPWKERTMLPKIYRRTPGDSLSLTAARCAEFRHQNNS